MAFRKFFAIGQIAAQDDGPDEHKQNGRNRGDQSKDGHHIRNQVNQRYAAQQTEAGEEQAGRGNGARR